MMNRAQRRHPENPAAHVHATPAGQPGGTIEISVLAAQILLDLCNIPAVGGSLRSAQAKLQVGMAQQELERSLAPYLPTPPATDEAAAVDQPAEAATDERSD